MHIDIIREIQETSLAGAITRRGVRTVLVSYDDLKALSFVTLDPRFILVAFDDRAELWLRRDEVRRRPDLPVLDLLAPHDLSLTWYEALSPAQRAEAATQARVATEIAPNHARPWALDALIKQRSGAVSEAIASHRRSLELDPDQATYHVNLGTALLMRGDLGSAEASFARATCLSPKRYEAHYNLGLARVRLGYYRQARQSLQRARDLAPNRPDPHFLLGVIGKQAASRRASLLRYLELAPDGPYVDEARRRLAAIESESKR
jgi:Flp pilus assembly protein TadD